jgi:hypothetical protein
LSGQSPEKVVENPHESLLDMKPCGVYSVAMIVALGMS